MSIGLRLKPVEPRHFGPKDHGRELTYDEFLEADYQEGYRYEIIDGRLYVSPVPNFSDDWYERFIYEQLSALVVVEIMKKDWKKDLVRNVKLYQEIPGILEYWIIDIRKDVNDPILKVFRRDSGDQDWTKADYPADAVYKTPLLRGFKLPVTPQW